MAYEGTASQGKLTSSYARINDVKMHYLEVGQGDPIVLLHGVPTSSYVWRNIIPYLSSLGTCIAPDLIGFGQSDKPSIDYSVSDHIAFFEEFVNVLNLKNITLIMHGFGSVIGLEYAMRHESNCKGIVIYEGFLRPLEDQDYSLPYQEQLITLQNANDMNDLNVSGASYVDLMLPQTIMREMSEAELDAYRHPFKDRGTDKPILQYLKELPNGVNKTRVDEVIAKYSKLLMKSKLPKLLLYSIPGFITTIATVMWAKEHLQNLEIVEIGEELHLAQESNPKIIGETISVWLQGLEHTTIT